MSTSLCIAHTQPITSNRPAAGGEVGPDYAAAPVPLLCNVPIRLRRLLASMALYWYCSLKARLPESVHEIRSSKCSQQRWRFVSLLKRVPPRCPPHHVSPRFPGTCWGAADSHGRSRGSAAQAAVWPPEGEGSAGSSAGDVSAPLGRCLTSCGGSQAQGSPRAWTCHTQESFTKGTENRAARGLLWCEASSKSGTEVCARSMKNVATEPARTSASFHQDTLALNSAFP